MNAAITRSYHVTVYPYENDHEEYSSFSITPDVINTYTLRIFLGCNDDFENPLYLGLCDDSVWFIDTEYQHGLTIPFPNTADDVYDSFIEIGDYDEEQSAVLAETVFLLYQDILRPHYLHQHNRIAPLLPAKYRHLYSIGQNKKPSVACTASDSLFISLI